MISLLKILNELKINTPGSFKFEDLKEGDIIEITFNSDATGEERTEIGEVYLDNDYDEKWINFSPLTNINYWRHELELVGSNENPWFQIFPEDIISIRKAKRPINELEIKNPNNYIIDLEIIDEDDETIVFEGEYIKNEWVSGHIFNNEPNIASFEFVDEDGEDVDEEKREKFINFLKKKHIKYKLDEYNVDIHTKHINLQSND